MTKDIFEKIVYFIKQKKTLVLVTILKNSGSTPRIKGTSMLVSHNGYIFGTIGGGFLEAKIIRYALKAIVEKKSFIIDINLSSEEAGGIGMICGGRLSIMLTLIFAKKTTEVFFESCLSIIKQGHKCSLLIMYDKSNESLLKVSYYLLYSKDSFLGENIPSKEELCAIKPYLSKISKFNISSLNNKRTVCLPICVPKLYIIGAGHVAQPTAKIAKIVGFDVIIMDDRETFANFDRFPNVESIKIVDFDNVFSEIYVKSDAFIVIITRGHAYDGLVLEQALFTKALYIGMIGSKSKRDFIFHNLKKKGLKKEDIKRVYSPIGIDINSETPEEIALSIVSEMVLVRAKGSKNRNREHLNKLV